MDKNYVVKLIVSEWDFKKIVDDYAENIVSVATEQTKKEEDAK